MDYDKEIAKYKEQSKKLADGYNQCMTIINYLENTKKDLEKKGKKEGK